MEFEIRTVFWYGPNYCIRRNLYCFLL